MPHLNHRKCLFFVLMILGLGFQAQGQEYQKAKDVLKATVVRETYLYQGPTLASRKMINLPMRANVLVYGKMGGFLEIGFLNAKGWVLATSVTVLGPVAAQPTAEPAPQPVPTPITAPNSIASQIKPEPKPVKVKKIQAPVDLPLRVNPYASFVLTSKSFYGQMRFGTMVTYGMTPAVSVGGLVEMVFMKGTYFSLGPTLRHQWNTESYFFNPSMDASFLYYYFDHNFDKDQGMGIQWALADDILVFRSQSFRPSITARAGADMMFFMFDEVRIPFFVTVGAAFRF